MFKKFKSPINYSNLNHNGNKLIDSEGNEFEVDNGIPDFIYPKILPKSDQESIEWYKNNAEFYDEFLPLTFKTFNVDEDQERMKMVKDLRIKENDKILEIGFGTGRDSIKILDKLGSDGELHLQDISKEILEIGVDKINKYDKKAQVFYSLSNAYYLPYEDKYFDKVFHFGGLNTFGDIKKAFSEMIRVIKPGGRIVVGDESMPEWLRDTEFGKVLMNSNHHYKFKIPFEDLPVEARNVKLEWIIGGVFYYFSFDVGEGTPYADLEFEIPGARGGTHKTRFYGQIEGVTQEAIELAKKARAIKGVSMHKWLDDLIKKEAEKTLRGE